MHPSGKPDLQTRLAKALAGQYTIVRQLGQGGMGTVFLARDENLQREVAIKVIAPDVSASDEVRQRFIQEARTVAKLRHPNIVAVYAAGEAEGLLYFVMEYVPGESLRDLMTRQPMSEEQGVPILRDLALALDYAHATSIVHRDVKPENVLLDGDTGRAMLTDFGVARAFAGGEGGLTGTGFVLGSPKYMSPEQASGDARLDGRSDLYSLGLIGYELFSGAPAVVADTAASMLVKHLTERLPSLATRCPELSPDIVKAIDRMLEKDPASRFQRGAHFAAALSGEEFDDSAPSWQVGRSGSTTGKRRKSFGRRRLVPIVASAVTLVGVAAAFVVINQRNAVNSKAWLVAPFEVQGNDQSLTWLREGSLNMLTSSLAQWADLHVVEYERTLDLLRDENLEDERRIGLESARGMARRVDAGRLVMGSVETATDSVIVTARLYDVATGRILERARAAELKTGDPRQLFQRVASELLDLAGAPQITLDLAKQTTTSVTAYRHYLDGLQHLNAWRLRAADSAFNRAIEADSTFALAYYKKAMGMGWEPSYDSTRILASQRAVEHAERLTPRDKELVRGHHELTLGFFAQQRGDTTGTIRGFLESRNRLARLVESDSTHAEAWYALADADYHLVYGTTYSRSIDTVSKYLTEALQGFQRTLQIDPRFHLAVQHLMEIYQQGAQSSGAILIGDTVKVLTPALRASLGPDQIKRYRDQAGARARTAAESWVAMDPDAINARRTLANIYVTLGQPDSSVEVLRAAMRRPATADPSLEWQIPLMMVKAGNPDAGVELRNTFARYQLDDYRRQSQQTRLSAMLGAATVAAASGMPSLVDSAFSVLESTDSVFPGARATPVEHVRQWFSTSLKVTMGVPMTADMRRDIVAALRDMERNGTTGDYFVPYLLYLETRDTLFFNTAVRWANAIQPALQGFQELQAFEALQRGDTVTAARIARTFPPADTVRQYNMGMNGVRIAVRAAVLAQLGNARGALAQYEAIDPKRFVSGSSIEPGWPMYVRSFHVRGKLYEELGMRDEAIEAYEKFLDLWKHAEAPVQPQLRDARQAVARLKEQQTGQQVKRG